MKPVKDNRAASSFLILAGLWSINVLIVVFGAPFLIYNKIKRSLTAKNDPFAPREEKKSASYFPCRIDS